MNKYTQKNSTFQGPENIYLIRRICFLFSIYTYFLILHLFFITGHNRNVYFTKVTLLSLT